MKAVKIAILNGGKVSHVLEIEASRTAPNAIVRAAKGTRFVVMGSNDAPAPQPILARRFGRNLFVDLDPEGGDLPLLIIEDFPDMQAELIGKNDDGTYHAYVQQGDADLDAAYLVDGGGAELVLAADRVAGSGVLGESLVGAGAGAGVGADADAGDGDGDGGATAGLGGLALAVLAGLGPAGINAVLANDRKQDGTGAGGAPPGRSPVPDEAEYVFGDVAQGDSKSEHVSDVEYAPRLLDGVEALVGNDGAHFLRLTGADQALDLSVVADRLPSVEVIDVTGIGENALTLSLNDVLEHGGMDMFIEDSSTQMLIKGDAGGSVELSDLLDGIDSGDWAQQSGTVTMEGAQYAAYVHSVSNAELLVQSGVQVHLDHH